MNLIDRDELELDTEWSDYYDGFTSYSQSQINGAVEVQAISLDKIKQARKEIKDINEVVHDGQNHYYKDCAETKKEVLAIIDKLITESEDKE